MNQWLQYLWSAARWLYGPVAGSIAGRITPADLKRIAANVGLMVVALLAIMATGTEYAAQLMFLVATGLTALQSAVQRLLDGKPVLSISGWFHPTTVIAISPAPTTLVPTESNTTTPLPGSGSAP